MPTRQAVSESAKVPLSSLLQPWGNSSYSAFSFLRSTAQNLNRIPTLSIVGRKARKERKNSSELNGWVDGYPDVEFDGRKVLLGDCFAFAELVELVDAANVEVVKREMASLKEHAEGG